MDALASEGGLCESEIAPEYSGDAVKSAKSAFFDCFFGADALQQQHRSPGTLQPAKSGHLDLLLHCGIIFLSRDYVSGFRS